MSHTQTNPYLSLAAVALTSGALVISTLVGCRKDAPEPSNADTAAEAPTSATERQSPAKPPSTGLTKPVPRQERVPTSGTDPHSDVRRALAEANTHPLSHAAHRADDSTAASGEPAGGPRADGSKDRSGAHGSKDRPGADRPTKRVAAVAAVEPEPEPEAEDEDELEPGDALEMLDGVAAHGVEKRIPQEPSTFFEEGKVWVWARIKNPGDKSQIRMFWKHDGRIKSRVDLDVGTSPGWRTWSRKTMTASDAGDWTVEVRTWDGRLLDTVEFEVTTDAFARSDHSDEN